MVWPIFFICYLYQVYVLMLQLLHKKILEILSECYSLEQFTEHWDTLVNFPPYPVSPFNMQIQAFFSFLKKFSWIAVFNISSVLVFWFFFFKDSERSIIPTCPIFHFYYFLPNPFYSFILFSFPWLFCHSSLMPFLKFKY